MKRLIVWLLILMLVLPGQVWGATDILVSADIHYDVDGSHGIQSVDTAANIVEMAEYYGVTDLFVLGDIYDVLDENLSEITTIDGIFSDFSGSTYFVVGNHEYIYPPYDETTNYAKADAWCTADTYCQALNYIVDIGDWRIICIDTVTGAFNAVGNATAAWLETQLAAADAASKYTMVFSHVPVDQDYPSDANEFTGDWYSLIGTSNISSSGTTGSVTLTTDVDVFNDPDFVVGMNIHLKHAGIWGYATITSITDARHVVATVSTTRPIQSTDPATDWGWGTQGYFALGAETIRAKLESSTSLVAVVSGHIHTKNYRTTVNGVDYIQLKPVWNGVSPGSDGDGSFAIITLNDDGTYVLRGAESQRSYNTDVRYVDDDGETWYRGGLPEYPMKTMTNVFTEINSPDNEAIRDVRIAAGVYELKTYTFSQGTPELPLQFNFSPGAVVDCGGSGTGMLVQNSDNLHIVGNPAVTNCGSGVKLDLTLDSIFIEGLYTYNNVNFGIEDSTDTSTNILVKRFKSIGNGVDQVRVASASAASYEYGFINGLNACTYGLNVSSTGAVKLSNITVYNAVKNIFFGASSNVTAKNIISFGGSTDDFDSNTVLGGSLTDSIIFAKKDFSGITTSNIQEGVNPGLADPANNNFLLLPNSPAINAGAVIAGIHDQATPATDLAGTSILTTPDIGAYEYADQRSFFNAAAADGGNGTNQYPYNAWTDYTLTGYNLRAGAEIYLQGDMGTLDLSGLTDTGAKTIKAWPRRSGSISGFIGGANDTIELIGQPGKVFKGAFQ